MTDLAKQQIAHQFSRAAMTYDEAAQLQNEMADHLLSKIPDDLKGQLVDLGCGTGYALEKLAAQKRFKLSAIDLAPGMIEFASNRVSRATFHCCDLESTPLESNSMDVVFSNAAIQWCKSTDAISEMYRVCKPGGKILFSTFGPNTLREIRNAWQVIEPNVERVHQFESLSEIEGALTQNGLANSASEQLERFIEFNSSIEMLRSLKQIGATNASRTRQTGLLGASTFRRLQMQLESTVNDRGKLTSTFECFFVSVVKPSLNQIIGV